MDRFIQKWKESQGEDRDGPGDRSSEDELDKRQKICGSHQEREQGAKATVIDEEQQFGDEEENACNLQTPEIQLREQLQRSQKGNEDACGEKKMRHQIERVHGFVGVLRFVPTRWRRGGRQSPGK